MLGYVILENHIHLIAKSADLAHVVARSKSYLARKILDRYKQLGATDVLRLIRFAMPSERKRNQEFQLWKDTGHPEAIEADAAMWQKLEYIHDNPVKRGWISDPLHWRHSSAPNYARQPRLIDVVTDW